VITVPGADDVMLGYQSLSFHDALYARRLLGLRPAPEFERWLQDVGLLEATGRVQQLHLKDSALAGLGRSALGR